MIKFSYKDAILNKIPQLVENISIVNLVKDDKKIEILKDDKKVEILKDDKKVKILKDDKKVKVSYQISNKFVKKNHTVKVQYQECDKDMSEEEKEEKKEKKKVNQIFVQKDSIPSKDDIIRLCSHGMYIKIKNIHYSHFTDENIKFYIHHMHNKINEIKVWKKEEKNNNEISKKRFKNRIDNIYQTINLIKSKHLEYIGNTIMEDKEGKWEKVGK